jgi:hypothetical protein
MFGPRPGGMGVRRLPGPRRLPGWVSAGCPGWVSAGCPARDGCPQVAQQVAHERPWICGLSYWSFNDYASRYPGTGMDGYRRWGLVNEYREPRPLYHHFAEQVRTRGLDE